MNINRLYYETENYLYSNLLCTCRYLPEEKYFNLFANILKLKVLKTVSNK